MRKQIAVYWPFTGTDQFGKKTWGTAVQIKCRWEDVSEEFLDWQGERQMSKARVYVDRDTPISGLLFLGDLEDVAASSFSTTLKDNEGVWEIMKFENMPNLRVTEFLKSAFL